MESGVHVTNNMIPSSPVLHLMPERTQVISPTQLPKLPPIAPPSDKHPSATYLQTASTQLTDTMRHLLAEVM